MWGRRPGRPRPGRPRPEGTVPAARGARAARPPSRAPMGMVPNPTRRMAPTTRPISRSGTIGLAQRQQGHVPHPTPPRWRRRRPRHPWIGGQPDGHDHGPGQDPADDQPRRWHPSPDPGREQTPRQPANRHRGQQQPVAAAAQAELLGGEQHQHGLPGHEGQVAGTDQQHGGPAAGGGTGTAGPRRSPPGGCARAVGRRPPRPGTGPRWRPPAGR